MSDTIKKVEAIVFAVGRAISEQELSELSKSSVADVHHAMEQLQKEYATRESPLLIISEGDAWKLTVHEKYLSIVQQINPHTELSKAVLETLAVIAWKQPSTQSDVIKIRTNKAYEHIDELERLGFVSKEKYGRSYLLKVTQKFFDYFDLPGNQGIKQIFRDVKDIGEAQAKLDGLETYGQKEEESLEQEGKEHIGGLEVFDDVHEEEAEITEDSFADDSIEQKPSQNAEAVIKQLAQEASVASPKETQDDDAEEEPVSEQSDDAQAEDSDERMLAPELEHMAKDTK